MRLLPPIKSLFWKIFLIVWLSNLTIVFVTALIIFFDIDKERMQRDIEHRIERSARLMIHHYENPNTESIGRPPPRHFRNKIQLIDLTNNAVIFGQPRLDDKQQLSHFEFNSDSGKPYRVSYQSLRRPITLRLIYSRFSPIKLTASLLVISLFSVLLSWLIVEPIKRLRAHTKALVAGDLTTRIEGKLATRQDEIGALAVSMNQMSDHINELIDDKQQLLYDVSHELKAPLARMQVAIAIAEQMAEDKGLPLKSYQQVEKDITTLTQMIDHILMLARIEQEPSAQSPQNSLLDYFEQTTSDAQLLYPNRNITLWTSESVQTLADSNKITINQMLLDRALPNLLNNALKYSQAAVELNIDTEQDEHNGDWLMISVEDNGPGIAEDKLNDVFRPFVRASTDVSGHGLGLAIAQKAIARLGGTIIVKNKMTKNRLMAEQNASDASINSGNKEKTPNASGGLQVVIKIPLR